MRQNWSSYRAIIVPLACEEKKQTELITTLVHRMRTLAQKFRTSAAGGLDEKECEQA